MRFERIAHWSRAELSGRLRQERYKLLERLHLVGSGALDARSLCSSLAPGPLDDAVRSRLKREDLGGAMQLLLERFRERARERFFVGATHQATPALISELMPTARQAVLEAAEKSLSGSFDLLGYGDLKFGEPVDWHLDPVSGITAPLKHWSRIDPLDRASIGDHKIIWELNRHQWLLHWAQAYAFTRDERYAEQTLAVLERWQLANPPGQGVNWASSLELAMRLIAWCWVLVLLRDSAALRPEVFVRVLGAIHAHATHVARHLSTTFSPNTHLLGEALGLLYVSVLFPENEEAAGWRTIAQHILVEQLGQQVLPDGVCFEQSTCYQRYTAEMYMHYLILAERNGLPIAAGVRERVEHSVDFLLALSRADGSVAQIGDGDGGWLLPLLPRKADDMRGVFATAATLFRRREFAEAAGGHALESAWLLGPRIMHDVVRIAPARYSPSRLFEAGGYAVLRTDFGPNAHQLTFDVGPLGCPISGAHGHADLLALTCDIFGEPCMVDPGMPNYGGDPKWRDAFRSTALHNSVMVDACSQAVPNGPFSWKNRPRARLRSWISNAVFDFVDGEHDAYRFGSNALTHRRRVIFVKPSYWIVIDDIDEVGHRRERRVELCFQFAPRHDLRAELDWVRVVTPGGHALLVRAIAAVPLETAIHEGEQDPLPIRGWFSGAYGNLQPAPALVYTATTQLPLRVVTLLLPVERSDAPLPELFPPESDAHLLRRLAV